MEDALKRLARPICIARATAVLAVLGGMAASGGPALAQGNEIVTLTQNIRQLETQLRVLQREVYRDGGPRLAAPREAAATATTTSGSSPATAQLQVRLDQFEQEVRTLTGQVEELGFSMRQAGARLDKLVADVDFRLRTLEGGAPAPVASSQPLAQPGQGLRATPSPQAAAAAPPRSTTPGVLGQLTDTQLRRAGVTTDVQPVSVTTDVRQAPLTSDVASAGPADPAALRLPVELPPEDQYQFARAYLVRGDYAGAEGLLREFVSVHPRHQRAGNAQYWLGETYYVRQNYLEAARMFAEGYQHYPESDKAPDNLLKLGLSLVNLDRSDDACITLTRLTTEYGNAPANILRRAGREQQRLGCG